MSESKKIQFEGLDIQWLQRPYRKNLSIQIKPSRKTRQIEIFVKSNVSTEQKLVLDFLREKKSWILKSVSQLKQRVEQAQQPNILAGEKFPFLGQMLQLRFVITPNKNIFFSVLDAYLNIHIPESQWNSLSEEQLATLWPVLQKFYKREAIQLIGERMQIWTATMQLHPKQVRFKNQTTRWGSCSSKGVINLNWRLIAAPLEVIDYILIHELSHLKHMNHSSQFWELVGRYCDHVSSSEKWLKNHGHSLDFLIRNK